MEEHHSVLGCIHVGEEGIEGRLCPALLWCDLTKDIKILQCPKEGCGDEGSGGQGM